MANKQLFGRQNANVTPSATATNTLNREGAAAYSLPHKHILAQYAATGCFNGTFYAKAEAQLGTMLELATVVEPEFLAKTAVYARRNRGMKDMPALLCAMLSILAPNLLETIFTRVINDGRMLRNFVQIIRSGVLGRKSLGTMPRRLVRQWLDARGDDAIFRASVGNAPSLADIIKMVHPRPSSTAREALYGYLLGRCHDKAALPPLVRQYEAFLNRSSMEVPDLPFPMLASPDLTVSQWMKMAEQLSYSALRMNLNTLARYWVFQDFRSAEAVARRLRDRNEIEASRVLPYQILAAYRATTPEVPAVIKEALFEAMEICAERVPAFEGNVWVCPDVSGSMLQAITGDRPGATSAVRCVDVAALAAAAVARRCSTARVLPFSDRAHATYQFSTRAPMLVSADRLAEIPGGGTDCSAPLRWINRHELQADLVIIVSDSESWVDARPMGQATALYDEWMLLKNRNPRAKLVCMDLTPNQTTQAMDREDILNVGGFSDDVWEVIRAFATDTLAPNHWVGVIEKVPL